MYAVSQEFMDAMKADLRHVIAKAQIDYTDPFIDQSITVTPSEDAYVSYPQQTADAVDATTYKWACLDGSFVLDGTCHPAPTPNQLTRYQFGWWGTQFAGGGGLFAAPYPALTVTHVPRPVRTLKVVGDSIRGEYPVDFTIQLYDQNDALLYTETVTGNTGIKWSKALNPALLLSLVGATRAARSRSWSFSPRLGRPTASTTLCGSVYLRSGRPVEGACQWGTSVPTK